MSLPAANNAALRRRAQVVGEERSLHSAASGCQQVPRWVIRGWPRRHLQPTAAGCVTSTVPPLPTGHGGPAHWMFGTPAPQKLVPPPALYAPHPW